MLGDGRREVWPITVTTYDSAYIHMKEIGKGFRLVVFDEAHHLPGPTLHESALDCLAPRRLGLTATPERADQQERLLAALIGPFVFREDIAEAKGRTLADDSLVRVPIYLGAEEQASSRPARSSAPTAGSSPSSIGRRRGSGWWKTSCGCTPRSRA